MKELFDLIGSFGGLVVLASLFVWNYLSEKSKRTEENEKRIMENEKRDKDNQDMLKRMDKSNENIAKSIDAINNTTEVLKEYIIKHDERAKKISDNVEYIKENMKEGK